MRVNSISYNLSKINLIKNQNKNFRPKNIGIDTVSFSGHKEYPVYLIGKDLTCFRFDGAKEAAKFLDMESSKVNRCLNTASKKELNGYLCTSASTIEVEKNGEVKVDKRKLLGFVSASDWGKSRVPVYKVLPNGKYEKYESVEKLACELGLNAESINKKVKSGFCMINGIAVVSSLYFEDETFEGEVNLDTYNQIIDEFNKIKKDSICAIFSDGSYKIYDSIIQASNDTKAKYSLITSIINNASDRLTTNGKITFERLAKVAKKDKDGKFVLDENGALQVDERLIAKTREVFLDTTFAPVVLILPDGSYQVYDRAKTLKEERGIKDSHLTLMLNCAKSIGGCTAVRMKDVASRDKNGILIFDENNNYIVDRNMIEQRYELAKLDKYYEN